MIIDAHVHIGKSLFGHELTPDELLENMEKTHIDKAIIIPFKPKDYNFEPQNDIIAETVKRYPDKFLGFGRIDPWQKEEAEKETLRIFNQLNLLGLFIDPCEELCPLTSPVLTPIFEMMREINKPVMFSGGQVRNSHPRQIEYIARKYPEITFIATSGGQINICGGLLYDAEEMLKKCPNVIMETSGIYRRDFIEQMTKKLGASRVIFGSGTPYYNQSFEIERIKTAHISNEKKEMLLGKNIDRLTRHF
jgi:predicted TIM-barrel fold metal-dependent hydrolase